MKRFVGVLAVVALTGPMAQLAMAQSKTLTGETKLVSATVEAIEASTRTLTLKLEDGTFSVVAAPAAMKRFSELRVGDKVRARYYENVVLRVKQPGEKDVDTATTSATPSASGNVGGTAAKQRTITATIAAIDNSVPSITFTGPNGWKYSSRVRDKAALGNVKVGDRVEITWTEALLVSIDEPGQ